MSSNLNCYPTIFPCESEHGVALKCDGILRNAGSGRSKLQIVAIASFVLVLHSVRRKNSRVAQLVVKVCLVLIITTF